MSPAEKAQLRAECYRNPARFNRRVLGRPAYWWRQAEICEAVKDTPVVYVPAGNAVGKSYVDAGNVLSFLCDHPGCLVLCTAPTQVQLEEVLWKEIERAYRGSRVPLGGRVLKSPLKIDFGGGWQALAYSTTKTERLSGHHAGDLFAVLDEASGILPEIYEAIDSCNPSRRLETGNPLRPAGPFYERIMKSEAGADPDSRVIRIPSLESPDIHLERSRRGLADATWLRKARNDYGEGSAWWLSHVLARFPDEAADQLLPRSWLDTAAQTVHLRVGKRRMAIDLAEGANGDPAGYLVRDDNGVLDYQTSRQWNLEETAKRAGAAAERWNVKPSDVVWDATGLGADFRARLNAVRLGGALPYKGGTSGGKHFKNLRTAAAWQVRQRLDPHRQIKVGGIFRNQHPFAIPAAMLLAARAELQGLRYEQLSDKLIQLEDKDNLKKLIGHSPTFADLLIMSFAYP